MGQCELVQSNMEAETVFSGFLGFSWERSGEPGLLGALEPSALGSQAYWERSGEPSAQGSQASWERSGEPGPKPPKPPKPAKPLERNLCIYIYRDISYSIACIILSEHGGTTG